MADRVFRIEFSDGHGICEGANGLCGIYHQHSDHHHGCGIDTCFGGRDREAAEMVFHHGYKFGFPSLKALRKWFPLRQGRCAMAAAGGFLVEYEVDAPAIHDVGDHQVIFDYDRARKIAIHSLEEGE